MGLGGIQSRVIASRNYFGLPIRVFTLGYVILLDTFSDQDLINLHDLGNHTDTMCTRYFLVKLWKQATIVLTHNVMQKISC